MTVVEFQLCHKLTTVLFKLYLLTWCNYYSTCGQNGESSSVVLVSTYCQLGISTSMNERERVYGKQCVYI